ncbi:hypothetical protein [Rhodoferax ferrireducens]|uniref:hypothetical protein n=1 Tax=Rhodoferax ferrireducens TaxID=192843 RepID=UPI0018E5365E|nr:hypothetical protein [Rhodoferax ferrireducens]
MENDLRRVYRKSEQGVAEVKSRAAGLSIRTRTTLILVNGLDSVAALQKKIGTDATSILQELAAQGHIEPVPSKSTAAVMPSPTDAPTLAASVPADTEVAARLTGLRREALSRLAPLFGPDVVIVAKPLLTARTRDDFGAALDGLEAKLHIYLGRKRAAALVAALRP